MQFPQTVEYALRAMTWIVAEPDHPWRSHDLAARAGIPEAYLAKVLRKLVRAGLLDSQRGHGGGFRLTRAPAEISFADVLQAVDYQMNATSCVFGDRPCDASRPCPLHPSWAALRERFQEWATSTTMGHVERSIRR